MIKEHEMEVFALFDKYHLTPEEVIEVGIKCIYLGEKSRLMEAKNVLGE